MNPSKICVLLESLISYLFYTTTYNHIFLAYSYCNIDDCSWGTKGLNENENNYFEEKVKFV